MGMLKKIAVLSIVALTLCAFAVDSTVLAKEVQVKAKEQAVKSKKKANPELVSSVQRALVDAGYKVKVDGKIGREMRTALKKYQKKNKLKATGRIDKGTLKKMGLDSATRM